MLLFYLPSAKKLQRFILILASFVFYAANQPALLLLLLFSIAINITTSYLVQVGSPSNRKCFAALGVVLNLGVLAFFKYSPLLGRTLFGSPSSIGEFLISIPLPIGISFFTFQGITLLVDTLRSQERNSKLSLPFKSVSDHAINTTLYISFFPQLVAGPIVKAHDFIPQITTKSIWDVDWNVCFNLLVSGYFLKIVIADNLKDQTFWITYPYFEALGTGTLIALLFGYSMQIFADFAGYSLIALGVAGLFGYRLPANFNFPYISRSFSEFWKRWHISLSSFLMEYLYIPIGGNRKGQVRTYINLMIVMLLGGLWHGAAWSYMVWGGFHGLALATERFFSTRVHMPSHLLVDLFRIIVVFTFVTFAWLLFKLTDFSQVISFVNAMVTNVYEPEWYRVIASIMVYSIPVVLYHLHYLVKQSNPNLNLNWLSPLTYGTMLFLLITNSGTPSAFVYFQF